jgi:hypothetical protein
MAALTSPVPIVAARKSNDPAPSTAVESYVCTSARGRWLVGAVGIELKATLKTRKLLILLNAEMAKKSEFAHVRYTPGTPVLERTTFK